jgi:flagellar motor switch protein FliM
MTMKEALSEEEMEALMDGVAAGRVGTASVVPAGQAIPYDLADQDHIVRGQLPVLEMINVRFVRHFENGLTNILRSRIEVSVDSLQTVRLADYIHSLGVPVSLHLVGMKPLSGEAVVVFDPELVFSVVDIFFGGDGNCQDQENARELTPTERRVVQRVLNQILKDMKDAWEPVLPVEFEFHATEASPQYTSIATSREMLVISSFRVELNDGGGEFHIGLPCSMLEPISELLDGGLQRSQAQDRDYWLLALQQKLQEVDVEVRGVFAETELTLREVLGLKAGDVIPLKLPDRVTLQVDDVTLFSGQFGLHKGRNAVKIFTGTSQSSNSTRGR